MKDTGVFRASSRLPGTTRLIAAWRGLAQLGMLVDGRAHVWTAAATGREPTPRPALAEARATLCFARVSA